MICNYQHATAIKIYGCGLMIVGESGSGKTDLALSLLTKGHCLIADDLVEVSVSGGKCYVASPHYTADKLFMYVRDLGFIDVIDYFGKHVAAKKSELELIVKLNLATVSNDAVVLADAQKLIVSGYDRNHLLDPLSMAKEVDIAGVKVKQYELCQSVSSMLRPISVLLETLVQLHIKRAKNIDYCQQFIDHQTSLS